jgi:superfamily II DNA or RNA helicase
MGSFAEFILTFDSDINRRGRQFEQFVKWFLKSDPEWATQVDEVWLWDEYPGRWGPDCGIDLVFKSKIGKTWAVQAKCYSAEYDISKIDVDTFLSESNRKQIDHRLLIATTNRIGSNARQVLDAQEKSVVRYLLSHFESAAIDFPNGIQSLSSGKRKPPPELDRPHQIEAVDAVLSGFQTGNRGQLIMACGTGKTFVCLWVKEQLKAKRTLVLVPSLNLLSQILNEWTFAAREPFDALCVCSDQTVGKRSEDEAITFTADLPFPVSNDVNEIADFLRQNGAQVIFSTYQSSPFIADAQKLPDVAQFDLVIADEAHRCAGKIDTVFGTVLDDQRIKADKRLFATATPRVYRTSLKKAAEELGVEVVDMSDEKSFGKRFHTLTFGEAIKREQLTDYRVLIVGVDDERIKEWIENRRLIATDTGFETDARSLAGQIGLLKAIKDWKLRRLISFHSRVKAAQAFSEDIIRVAEWLDDDHKPFGNMRAEYVCGEMPTILRRQKLMRLKNVANGEIGLLSNAKCLSEGVDVPALDGVAFIDPRSSEIDIIQSVGRAIRLSENKTVGTIVIPVFIEQTDNPEQALAASDFKPIWDVLEALKSHDERLSDELDQLRIELGAKRRRSVGASDLTKIVFDLPTSVNENFARSLRARLVEKTTEPWMFWFGLLERFVEEHGHSRVVSIYKTDAGYTLGSWVRNQRILESQLEPNRRLRLEALAGWSWDPNFERWEEGFAYLKHFSEREGHCRVPLRYKCEDGYPLGTWVQGNRLNETLDCNRRQRLEALPGWSWEPRSDLWETGFAHLKAFADREGHCRVPYHYKTDDGYSLGKWVNTQRMKAGRTTNYLNVVKGINLDRKKRLETISGWSWAALDEKWKTFYAELQKFSHQEGHSRVPQHYKTVDGVRLGRWVSFQKMQFSRGRLEADRARSLVALPGWVWPAQADRWEEGFAYLKQFSEREGHCRVPKRFTNDEGYPLGKWTSSQRTSKELNLDRRQLLEALPDWSWASVVDRLEARWETGFAYLEQFLKREGHCIVPLRFSVDNFPLGFWVRGQRQSKADGAFIHLERQKRLEALPSWTWTPWLDMQRAGWNEGFEHLKQFAEREGHSRVASQHKTDSGFLLGRWVVRQRIHQGALGPDQRRSLEALPNWTWTLEADKAGAWEECFNGLRRFSEREGHCRVPQNYQTTEGFRLGEWASRQRRQFRADKLHPDRRQRLEALPGWAWKKEKLPTKQDDQETVGGA